MRLSRLAGFALAFVLAVPALAAAAVKPGEAAPSFTLQDANGKSRSLGEFKGKTVVLEWTNAECPFVRKHYESGHMQALQKRWTDKGVVWLVINSSAAGKQGHVDGAAARATLGKEGASPTAYLLDSAGTTGKAYGATATPHMFVIDGAGKLVYMGAIDDTPSADQADLATAKNYVDAALAELAAGKPVTKQVTKAYGCSVKYAD